MVIFLTRFVVWVWLLTTGLILGLNYPRSTPVQPFLAGIVDEGKEILARHGISTISEEDESQVFLPLIFASRQVEPFPQPTERRVNAPHFEGDVPNVLSAIFWFGKVTPTENYADVRVGYNDQELVVYVAAFDRRLWYDTSPSIADLEEWDAGTLYLDLTGNTANAPGQTAYRLVGQLSGGSDRALYQAVYRGNGSGWILDSVPITTTAGWRGDSLNSMSDDRGWGLRFRVPFNSLGLSAPPTPGTVWGMALVLHDRDDDVGTPIPDKNWPEELDTLKPGTWGQLAFGLPGYAPPPSAPAGLVTIRHRLDGADVVDGHVGGHSNCGGPYYPDFFNGWGEANYAGYEQFNIQNQIDVADWPCFSKYYVTFPLGHLPAGKVVISATLTLHLFGTAGGGGYGEPPPSYIQVLTVVEDWDEQSLTWNNAPLSLQNVSIARVDPMSGPLVWPGEPRVWDVSLATAEAYASGSALRLVLYSADTAYHSGKYFVSSDTGDWNERGRPTLQVLWGEAP